MSPKFFGLLMTILLLTTFSSAEAQQQAKLVRVGWLASGSPSGEAPLTGAVRQGLRELGYVEGKNIAIEYRYAERQFDRLPDLATEIVHLKVDVIVVANDHAIRAAPAGDSDNSYCHGG